MERSKKYTQEFKDSAIQLALNSKDSVRKIKRFGNKWENTL